MTDREKLIELIDDAVKERCINVPCKDCTYYKPGPYPCRNEAIADHLIDNGVTVQRWIPVTERLPEDKFEVLAKTEYGGQVVAIYDSEHKEWQNWSDEYREYYGFCGYMGKVTHWMPLPEPPEEEICNSVTG